MNEECCDGVFYVVVVGVCEGVVLDDGRDVVGDVGLGV